MPKQNDEDAVRALVNAINRIANEVAQLKDEVRKLRESSVVSVVEPHYEYS